VEIGNKIKISSGKKKADVAEGVSVQNKCSCSASRYKSIGTQ
jgi:hypothetical protein